MANMRKSEIVKTIEANYQACVWSTITAMDNWKAEEDEHKRGGLKKIAMMERRAMWE